VDQEGEKVVLARLIYGYNSQAGREVKASTKLMHFPAFQFYEDGNMKSFEPEKMKKIPFTGIRRVLERATQLANEGRKIIHFEIGQPDFDTPANIKEAAKKALDKGLTAYTSNFGLPPLRKAIAEKLSRLNELNVNPDTDIMVTVGGEEAVAASILAFLDAGDEALIPQP